MKIKTLCLILLVVTVLAKGFTIFAIAASDQQFEIKVAVCSLITAALAVIRNKKLERFIEAVNSGAIQPQEHCDMETLDIQDLAMKNYILVLGIRLTEEGIELPEVEG